jgi:hypothetical protein
MKYKFVDVLCLKGVGFEALKRDQNVMTLTYSEGVIHTHSPRYGSDRRGRDRRSEKKRRSHRSFWWPHYFLGHLRQRSKKAVGFSSLRSAGKGSPPLWLKEVVVG